MKRKGTGIREGTRKRREITLVGTWKVRLGLALELGEAFKVNLTVLFQVVL